LPDARPPAGEHYKLGHRFIDDRPADALSEDDGK
jgi:hypothetical protein